MEENIKYTKITRLFASVYDLVFILLAAFTFHMILGMIFRLDSMGFLSYMIYITLAIIIVYMLFGEFIFGNSFGKYLFGIEIIDPVNSGRPSSLSFFKRGLLKIIWPVEFFVLLFSRTKKRLGDIWSGSIVANRKTNLLKPYARIILGVCVIIVLYFSFQKSLGFAARKADFYKEGSQYLTYSGQVKIVGLSRAVSQSRDSVTFDVPVTVMNLDRIARVHLGRSDGKWVVSRAEFFTRGYGSTFGYSFSF